jgi:hypothetical protein
LTVKNGLDSRVLTFGVNGGGPGGSIVDNTIGVDTDTLIPYLLTSIRYHLASSPRPADIPP